MTAQVRETIGYRGQQREIRGLPLHGCDRPIPDFNGVSTGCYRGYRGTWELRDDSLHLVRLDPPFFLHDDDRDRLTEMFPESTGSVEAVWYSGEIAADDVTHPHRQSEVEYLRQHDLPLHFVKFTLLVLRGQLLSEWTTDLETGVTQARLTRHINGLFPPDEVGFLRALHADPKDDTAKLVYADWLDERDDPRGQVLRMELARRKRERPRPGRETAFRDWNVPTGFVSPESRLWYWCWLAGIPEPTPEDRRAQKILDKLQENR